MAESLDRCRSELGGIHPCWEGFIHDGIGEDEVLAKTVAEKACPHLPMGYN
jgi:hypothetical protein